MVFGLSGIFVTEMCFVQKVNLHYQNEHTGIMIEDFIESSVSFDQQLYRRYEWPREAKNKISDFCKKKHFFNKKLHNSSGSAGIGLKTCGIERSLIFTSKLCSFFFSPKNIFSGRSKNKFQNFAPKNFQKLFPVEKP